MPADSRDEASYFADPSITATADQAHSLVDALVEYYDLIETPNLRHLAGKRDLSGRDLVLYEAWLAEVHSYFRDTNNEEGSQNYASEWVLDNYYIIRQALKQIHEDLPLGFYRQLPKLASGSLAGLPRIYAIALGILSFQHGLLSSIDLETILILLQNRVPLKMGELWALPIFLRYGCIEALAQELKTLIEPQQPPILPESAPPLLSPTPGDRPNPSVMEERIVSNLILSLRVITEQNWNDFFESVSRVEQLLRKDPAAIYPLMDFKTRDLYRKEIEKLAFASGQEEIDLAQVTLDLAHKNGGKESVNESASLPLVPDPASYDDLRAHVGEYLLGDSRAELETQIGYQPNRTTTVKRWIFQHANILYLVSILSLVGLILALLVLWIDLPDFLRTAFFFQKIILLFIGLVVLVPVMTAAASLVNWLVTLLTPPRILPKLTFKGEIPPHFRTLVVIPALITRQDEVDGLVHQLEMHYLRNSETGLLFGLLTDFRDAENETLPEDDALLDYAQTAIADLNAKYKPQLLSETDSEPSNNFFILHRKRLWNASEGKWMGWERKRGKLHEMNLLLRGKPNLTFSNVTGRFFDHAILQSVRFVITLDADTILPRGGANRLIGTMAHPLNRAKFKGSTSRVIAGYTVLQPRMEIHPRSTNFSRFTRIYSGDTGLDLYTRAVSDAYQDLFGEGSYVGKGIYDVDAFERSIDHRIPENAVLSHDLLEGLMGRAGLVTDITMIEDYPQNYLIQMMRQRRWIRGDWQLLPWLLNPGKYKTTFSAIDRWKIFDNLLRSIMIPAIGLIFIAGMLVLPKLAMVWLAVVLLSLGIPVLTSTGSSILQALHGGNIKAAFNSLGSNLIRWVLALAFLPYEAYVNLDAIWTTLYRLTISHRYLLQWTTAAQSTRLLGLRARQNAAWQKMSVSILISLSLAAGIQMIHAITGTGLAPALLIAAPILSLWLFSPLIVWWISQPIQVKKIPLAEEHNILLRQVVRRTWGFFERFVGPEDHWLPPDHYQEYPVGIIAHHTSPSNIGLLLTSTIAAYDFGYLDQLGLVTRLTTTMDTLDQMERFRGHFLNWYDTLTLQPLHPRYISTVDSGNLAACLVITAQACSAISEDPVFRWNLWQGYLDTLSNLTEILAGMRKAGFDQPVDDIHQQIAAMRARILAVRDNSNLWYDLFETISGSFWADLSVQLKKIVEIGSMAFDLETLRKLQEVAGQVERLHLAVQRTLSELVPWIPYLEQPPTLFEEPQFSPAWSTLRSNLPYNPVLSQIHFQAQAGLFSVQTLRKMLTPAETKLEHTIEREIEAVKWLDALEQALTQTSINVTPLLIGLNRIAVSAGQLVNEMDFTFLFHSQRRVFHIGFNLDTSQLDNNYYDLLASEARISSLIAIAKGDVPQSHWLQLGRPITRIEGSYVLLSWSGTMFEYLMPPLFLRSYPGTLLADSAWGAVRHQMAYAKSKGLPWGISESGFHRFDNNQNYQYRAFGVPGLGFKRGLSDDLVIAPYASLMAISYDPHAVVHNLLTLIDQNALGIYGVYESVDFTAERMLLDETSYIVQEYMAHHQGMILMALVNYFHEDIMIQRMHRDARIQSVELLLQEQIHQSVPLQDPYADDIKGVRQIISAPLEITPWTVPVQTPIPQVQLLSNGTYNVLLSNMGGGYSSWRDVDLTRWQPDGVLDSWGAWIYIQEMGEGITEDGIWSATHQPVPGDAAEMQVTYFAHMAVFRRTERGIVSTMEVTVAPEDPLEIRRIRIHNNNDTLRNLRLTSYGEVILAPQMMDSRHPAFNKLFIQSEFVPELNLQIFTRRPRSGEEAPILMGHMLVVDGAQQVARHEADRYQFIGRGRSLRDPIALTSQGYLTGSSGATLDPIFSIGQEFMLEAHQSADLAYLTFTAESREALLDLARRYRSWNLIERTFHQADIAAQTWLGKQDFVTSSFKETLQILSALIYSFKQVRAAPETLAANRLGQSGLWRFGISGDYPILMVEIDNAQQVDLIREALQVHKYLRYRRFKIDLVILNLQQTDYGAELNGTLYRMVSKLSGEEWLNQRGGVFIMYADQIRADERILLQAASRVLLKGGNGSLGNQMPGYTVHVHHLPDITPTRQKEEPTIAAAAPQSPPLPASGDLLFQNGTGGFSADGREYIIDLPAGKTTPVPWVNVIGYPGFGFMVSESGSQCTWALNSGENRLTPWSNDPVRDPTGEALYLRDEETGDVWTPTPLPSSDGQPYRVTHGAGYTIFEHNSHGLRQVLTLFASPEDPVKIIHLKMENTLAHTRRITATQYVEWVLGTLHATSMAYIIPEYDPATECLMATNPYNSEFGARVAFLIASKAIHGLTADRTEFLGRGGTPVFPIALNRLGLETRITPGEDPCAVMQLHLDIPPDAKEEIYFVLGQGNDKEHALALVEKYHNPAHVGAALQRTQVFWDHLLNAVQVHTPEPATDLILNRWMLYQTLSCRLWGRTGFYQSSGAFGFRDQLQDALALLFTNSAVTRSQIMNAVQRQFEEGDVLHWWHPPSGRGVRTRFSDDLLWLPYATALYIEATGDRSILTEKTPFLASPPLSNGVAERYGEYLPGNQSFTLMEHCLRAIEKGSTTGSHGLPLIGTGDWNDGFSRVGEKGLGESVWLAWFAADVLTRFAAICDQVGDNKTALRYRSMAKAYAATAEKSAWDGDWYRRAYYDSGASLGSILDAECQIDAIAQSWAVISGAGDPERSRRAMQSVLERLVRPQERLSLLFTPPFDKTLHDPGYIKGYPPGIRENGGQYTHAAIWTAWAFAQLGDGKQAGALFDLLNPVYQADNADKVTAYRVEPYVVCADIYSTAPLVRRGGWTWYTGSAAWMYRLGLEAILGFKKIGDSLQINPVIPPAWDGFEIHYRHGTSMYHIQVHNPEHVARNVRQILLDGQLVMDGLIPLSEDKPEYIVDVMMGSDQPTE